MGIFRKALPFAFPYGRVGVALWAWRNRDSIMGWAGYAAKAAPRLVVGDTADVLAEGRLRARLTADGRTRNVDGLRVEVADGVATLQGRVSPQAHDAALDIATNTSGVARVRDELVDSRRR